MTRDKLVKATGKHPYYCASVNYNDNDAAMKFESWESFIAELGDMYKSEDVEEIDLYGECHLEIFFMLQKKGLFRPVTIKSIKEEDMKGIMEWLKPHWEYTNDFWKHTD